MAKLLLKFETAVIKEIAITKNVMTVGRKEDNDIVIDNAAVSGHHCKIFLESGTYFVEDLNSTNGTFVNEKKILKSGLRHNDAVGIVKHSLVFMDDKAATASAAPAPSAPAPVAAAPAAPAPAGGTQPGSAAPAATPAAAAAGGMGVLRVVSGLVDKSEYILNGASTYIGKSEKVQIPIKGMFAPDVAAMIAKRADGYFLCALKAGYPKLNGNPVQEKEPLKNGDAIEVGGTTFQFSLENK